MASTSSESSASGQCFMVRTLTSRTSWEYPNRQRIRCNTISQQDTPNFLSLLRVLRAHQVGRRLILTAIAPNTPWPNPNDKPSDISQFAKLLDCIAIMNYVLWGSWSPAVGSNTALNNTCTPPQYQQGSTVSVVQAWTGGGLLRN